MKLVQTYIPDIPTWNSSLAATPTIAYGSKGGIMDFFKRNWYLTLFIIAISVGVFIWWLSSFQKPMKKKSTEKQVPTPNLNFPNLQNPFRNV